MPEAFISSTTSPGPGVGSGKLLSSTLRSPRKTAPRTRLVLLCDDGLLAGLPLQRHRRSRALALPLLLVDLLAEEVELDRHVVRILEEDLEQRRLGVGEAAEVHLDAVLLDAIAYLVGVLRQEGDVVDGTRAGRALRMLLQQELVADLVRGLGGEVHAGLAVHLQPVAGEAEVGARRVDLHAEHALVEVLGALEILGDQQEMVEAGDGHGSLRIGALTPILEDQHRQDGGRDEAEDHRPEQDAHRLEHRHAGEAGDGDERRPGDQRAAAGPDRAHLADRAERRRIDAGGRPERPGERAGERQAGEAGAVDAGDQPTISTPKATKKWLCGIQPCAAWTSSNSRLGDLAPAGTPRMAPAVSAPPTKKKPAIGSTAPIALKANTKPSMMWSALMSRKRRGSQASVATTRRSVAVPPTSAAASPPLISGMPATNFGRIIARMMARKASGVMSAKAFDHFSLAAGTFCSSAAIALSPTSASCGAA